MTLTEIHSDLFAVPSDFALAHCISADFALGAGIAKQFNKKYQLRKRLFLVYEASFVPRWDRTQDRFRGGCIINFTNDRTIFNLVTKRNYWMKPELIYIKNALLWMKEMCEDHDIKKVAMPKIACGLDGQKWSDIKPLIEEVFKDTDIEFWVCSL